MDDDLDFETMDDKMDNSYDIVEVNDNKGGYKPGSRNYDSFPEQN
jgi:hypothetical protein